MVGKRPITPKQLVRQLEVTYERDIIILVIIREKPPYRGSLFFYSLVKVTPYPPSSGGYLRVTLIFIFHTAYTCRIFITSWKIYYPYLIPNRILLQLSNKGHYAQPCLLHCQRGTALFFQHRYFL